jgi:hypothetical protein
VSSPKVARAEHPEEHMKKLLAAALAAVLATPAAHAILIRPDRDDAEYLEMATKYTSFVSLGVPDGGGVLVNARWILTAAHMAKVVEEKKGHRIRVGADEYAVERVVIHAEWKKGGHSDIALILLRSAVRDVEPTPVYTAADEAGKTVVIVGSGYTGKIGEKATREGWDKKPRAAVNTVDKLGPRTLFLKIKDKDEASDLQGAAAPGDSGGPAFVNTPEGLRVIGIGYATDDTNANGIVGDIGDWEIYARASTYADWILKTMLDVAREEAAKLLGG